MSIIHNWLFIDQTILTLPILRARIHLIGSYQNHDRADCMEVCPNEKAAFNKRYLGFPANKGRRDLIIMTNQHDRRVALETHAIASMFATPNNLPRLAQPT